MYNSIVRAECVCMEKLEHLFIDLSYIKNQNKNFNVYRSRSFNQKNKKYLQIDEIKEALSIVDKTDLKYIGIDIFKGAVYLKLSTVQLINQV